MLLNSREFKFLNHYRNVYGKSSAKRQYRDENVFLKVDRALSKLITILISTKKEFKDVFKNRSSDIVLLKLGNLNQNANHYEARNTERDVHTNRSYKFLRAKLEDFFYWLSTFNFDTIIEMSALCLMIIDNQFFFNFYFKQTIIIY